MKYKKPYFNITKKLDFNITKKLDDKNIKYIRASIMDSNMVINK